MAIHFVNDMPRILTAIGVSAKRTSSGEFKAKCPKHFERTGREDKKPSWSINEDSGKHNCFSCGYKGNLVGLVMDLTEMDSWSTLQWLREEGMRSLVVTDRQVVSEEPDDDVEIAFVPSLEDRWFLFDHPPKEALQERNLARASAKHFDVRWDDGGWCLPIVSWRGGFMGYQWKKRAFVKNEPEGVLKSTTLFGIPQFPIGDQLVLVESPLDVLRLWQLGYSAVSSYGVEISADQIDLIYTLTDNVVVAFDDDAAGRRKARDLYEMMRHTVPELRFLDYSKVPKRDGRRAKDVGEMLDEDIVRSVECARYGIDAVRVGVLPMAEVETPKKGVPSGKLRRKNTAGTRRRRAR